jgi:signal transduction histidine kinase
MKNSALHNPKKKFVDILHDLRTPISIIAIESEVALLNNSINKKSLKKILKSNMEEARRMSKLLDKLEK